MSRTDKKSDWIFLVNPFANLKLRGEKGEVNIGGNAAIGRYATYRDENYNDYGAYANGRYNFSPMLSVSAGTAYDHTMILAPRRTPALASRRQSIT